MPFEVFRRHQKKMLATFAILAMFGFVLSDSLPRLLNSGPRGPENVTVVTLFGKPVDRVKLSELTQRRKIANQFMGQLIGFVGRQSVPNLFGDYSTRSLVDSLILEHEADKLGLPRNPAYARAYITDLVQQKLRGKMTRELFEISMMPLAQDYSGDQVLQAIAEEARINQAFEISNFALVTPLDVFDSYRDQTESASFRALDFPVEKYTDKVGDPTTEQISAFYDKNKDTLPDPQSPAAGFKIPRQIKVEYLTLDGGALAKDLKTKFNEEELKSYYETRKTDFTVPRGLGDLPNDVFAEDPDAKLTPPIYQRFDQVRDILANSLAEEKAQAEISAKFETLKNDVLLPFSDKYAEAADELAEAKKANKNATGTLPAPNEIATAGEKLGMTHEVTPLLSRTDAENYGHISAAEVGLTRFGGGKRFAEEFFDTKTPLMEPYEFTDPEGRRYLARKIEDNLPRVPGLDEVRNDVVAAWKIEQARPLADKAAEEYAATVRKDGGKITDEIVDGKPVINVSATTRLQPGGTPSLLAEFANPGDAVRTALFGLDDGQVAVAPNAPRTVYYVIALDRRNPASMLTLFGPNGPYAIYQNETSREINRKQAEIWLKELRTQAGLPANWVPDDEKDRDASRRSG